MPPDRAYVTRFSAPERPRLLTLPPGAGVVLAREVDEMRRNLLQRLPLLLDDRELSRQRDALGKRFAAEEEREVGDLRQRAEAAGFALVQVDAGPARAPGDRAGEGRPAGAARAAARHAMPEAEFAAKEAQLEALADELRELARGVARAPAAVRGRRSASWSSTAARTLVEEEIADVVRHVPDPSVAPFLDEVRDDVVAASSSCSTPAPRPAGGSRRGSSATA